MTFERLFYSDKAQELGLVNYPKSLDVISNLQQLRDFLTALENLLCVEINVNSGYRCPELNKAVGGSKNSYHMYGLAADITCKNTGRCTLTDLKALCKELRKTRLVEVIVHDTYVHIAIKKYS